MANSLAAALKYLNTMLDKQYKREAVSSDMDINPAWIRPADVAGTFYIPKLSMPGLGNVVGGIYPVADVTQTWGAYTYTIDRGRELKVEPVAKDEAGQVAEIAALAAEYLRMHVIPEADAVRFAKVAAGAASANVVSAVIDTSAKAIAATNAALVKLINAEVPTENLLFYATPDMIDLLDSAASSEKKARILNRAKVIEVPQGRFNDEITLNAGSQANAGGFTATGYNLNFILMDKSATFADLKHQGEKFFTAEQNQTSDHAKWFYRAVHDCWVFENKTTGIYVHKDTTDQAS